MAKDDKNDKATAADKTVRLYVRSVSPKGFRRIGRFFGPEEEGVDVTPEQAKILFDTDKAGDLRVMTQEMKDIAEGASRGAPRAMPRPAPRPGDKATDKAADEAER